MTTALELASKLRIYVGTLNPEAEQSAALVREILELLAISPPEIARYLEIAPQTVNRWRNGQIVPRSRQAQKLESWIRQREAPQQSASPEPDHDLNALGIRLSNEILKLEIEAKVVWIVKSGVLREANRGTIGECVLQGLQQGTEFNYVFLPHSFAAQSFNQLAQWLEKEAFAGEVTGYELKDPYLSQAIGLTEVSGAWIGMEYSSSQAAVLGRRFDVFFALAVREYSDTARNQTKNEDGQPCWLELATPQAARWLQTVKNLCGELKGNSGQKQARIVSINGAKF